MNYQLSLEDATYPVEDFRIAAESNFATKSTAQYFSLISPVRLPIGQRCALLGDSGGYPLLVNACLGFSFSPRFLVSGVITNAVDSTRQPA